jgi:molybdopterin-guanine dinucleotide biosynthesis protein A
MLDRSQISGVVLAGGRGMRMGGVDKGLQLHASLPLALHALQRLAPQVGATMVNANRHLEQYARFGAPVWPDALPDYAGPLAGFITALHHCDTPFLVTVPCDTPMFPTDLVARLAGSLLETGSDIAMAAAPETDSAGRTTLRSQPVFCLLHTRLLPSLEQFTQNGGRKIDAWTAQHKTTMVRFDEQQAFFNVNTMAELQALHS